MMVSTFSTSLVRTISTLRRFVSSLREDGGSVALTESIVDDLCRYVSRMKNLVPRIQARMADSVPIEGCIADIDRKLRAIASKWTEDISILTQLGASLGQGGVTIAVVRNTLEEMCHGWGRILGGSV